jgi:hypothetical protein
LFRRLGQFIASLRAFAFASTGFTHGVTPQQSLEGQHEETKRIQSKLDKDGISDYIRLYKQKILASLAAIDGVAAR